MIHDQALPHHVELLSISYSTRELGDQPKAKDFKTTTSRGSISSHADGQQFCRESQQHAVAPWAATLDDYHDSRRRWWLLIALTRCIVQSLHNYYAETSSTTRNWLVPQSAGQTKTDRHRWDASRSPGRLLPWTGTESGLAFVEHTAAAAPMCLESEVAEEDKEMAGVNPVQYPNGAC